MKKTIWREPRAVFPAGLLIVLSALRLIWAFPAGEGPRRSAGQEAFKPGQILHYDVNVVLKLVQVSVVDRKGRPVEDLTRDDFAVFDNGQPVAITDFEVHRLKPAPLPVAPKPAEPQPAAAPTAPATPGSTSLSRKFFFFFDFAFNNPRGIVKAKQAALDFLKSRVYLEDEAAVIAYSQVRGLRVFEYLTRDHQKIREAIETIDRKAASGRASEIEQQYWRESGEGAAMPRESAPGTPRAGSPNYNWERQEAKRIAQFFFMRLGDLARALRYVQGRKHFLFFSTGVPASMVYGAQTGSPLGTGSGRSRFDAGDTVLIEQNEAMLREFAASGCSFYTFDTRESAKVPSLFDYDEQTFASGYRDLFSAEGVFQGSTGVFKEEAVTGKNSLERLSQTTGGKYFGNIDAYARSLDQVQNLTGSFYVLGYPVPEREDGVFHEVRVEVKRPGCEVRGAGGYFNPRPFREFSELEKRLHLFDLVLNERAFSRLPERFPLKALPVRTDGSAGLVLVGLIPDDLASALGAGPLEFVSVVFDEKDDVVDTQRLELSDRPGRPCLFQARVPSAPGVYRCRLVVRNMETGKAAVSSVSRVTVGPAEGSGLAVFPPMLFTTSRGPVLRLETRGSFSTEGLRLAGFYPFDSEDLLPVFEVFEAGEELTVVVPCAFQESGESGLTVGTRLLDAGTGVEVKAPFFIKARERKGGLEVISLGLPAGALAATNYVLYVHVQDPVSGARAYGRTAFIVTKTPAASNNLE
jgi:VWFA-related protein